MNHLTHIVLYVIVLLASHSIFGQVSLGTNVGVYSPYLKNDVSFNPAIGIGVDLNIQKNKWLFGTGISKIADSKVSNDWALFEFDGIDVQIDEKDALLTHRITWRNEAFFNFFKLSDNIRLWGGAQLAFTSSKTSGEVTRKEPSKTTGETKIALHEETLKDNLFRLLGRTEINFNKTIIYGELAIPILSKYTVLTNANVGIRFLLTSSKS